MEARGDVLDFPELLLGGEEALFLLEGGLLGGVKDGVRVGVVGEVLGEEEGFEVEGDLFGGFGGDFVGFVEEGGFGVGDEGGDLFEVSEELLLLLFQLLHRV